MPCDQLSNCPRRKTKCSYLGHDRQALVVPHIPERHLRALMLIELELWMVDVRDRVEAV